MTLPARSMYAASLAVLDIQGALRRLPAAKQASVVWTRKPVEEAIRRLRTEPLTDELLVTVSQGLREPVRAMASVVWRALAESAEASQSVSLTDLVNEEVALLVAFLDDEDIADTVAWIIGFLRSVDEAILSHVGAAELAQALEHPEEELELPAFTRGWVALMAAIEEARAGGDVRRTTDLIDCSFLQFKEVRDCLRQEGIEILPFAEETREQRSERLLATVERLRSSLTDEDWRVLSEARMTDFR
ncbi:MAG: hypothetical protein KIT72_08650 [Polyangiaceae bacterium]|nr:hypothetical protein [Polyangiaceae bacterium]MCW5790477.1 hypothetical protein [Polyangiaceae bacterium]